MTNVWIVAQVKDRDTGDWELGGVFTTREKAVAACQHPDDAVWQETVDKPYPRDTSVPRDVFYPLRRPLSRITG